MEIDIDRCYRTLCARAATYRINVEEASLGDDKAGEFDGPTITINSINNRQEQAFFLAHSIGSVVRWSLFPRDSAATYAELRSAKEHRQQDPERFARALEGFCAFEEAASEHAVWLLADLHLNGIIAAYTEFARADLDAMMEFHRTGTAPNWREFFPRWKEKVTRGGMVVRPYEPRLIPAFQPILIETQEIVHEKD